MSRTLPIALVLAAVVGVCFGSTEYSLLKPEPGSGIMYTCPAWAPDGRSIAYTERPPEDPRRSPIPWTKGRNIWLAEFKGGHWHHRLLLKDADSPSWSPDGRKLAFARGGISVLQLHNGRVVLLDRDRYAGPEEETYGYWPGNWSPDGRFLVFQCSFYEGWDNWLYDWTGRRSISAASIGNCWDWSPDGRYSLSAFSPGPYFDPTWAGFGDEPFRVIRIDLRRLKWRTIMKGYNVESIAWPHGGRYAWVNIGEPEDYHDRKLMRPPDGAGIYRLDLDTRKLYKLVNLKGDVFFSPDYRRFAFISTGKDNQGPYRLYIGDTKTWHFRLLSADLPLYYQEFYADEVLSWAWNGRKLAYVVGRGEIRIVTFDP